MPGPRFDLPRQSPRAQSLQSRWSRKRSPPPAVRRATTDRLGRIGSQPSDATAKSDRPAKVMRQPTSPLAKFDPPAEGNTSAERSAPIPIASSPPIGTSPAPSVTPPPLLHLRPAYSTPTNVTNGLTRDSSGHESQEIVPRRLTQQSVVKYAAPNREVLPPEPPQRLLPDQSPWPACRPT